MSRAVVGYSSVDGWELGGRLDRLLRVLRGAGGARGISDAIGHLMVAQGSFEVALESWPSEPWDWCATSVIVSEAGGRMTAMDGSPPGPGSDDLPVPSVALVVLNLVVDLLYAVIDPRVRHS